MPALSNLTGSQQGDYSIREYCGIDSRGRLEARVYIDSLHRGMDEDQGDDNDPLSQLISQEEEEEIRGAVEGATKEERAVLDDVIEGRGQTWMKMAREHGVDTVHKAYALRDKLRKKYEHRQKDKRPYIDDRRMMLHVMGLLQALPDKLYTTWEYKEFKEYRKPTKNQLRQVVEDVLLQIGGGRVVVRSQSRRRLGPVEGQLQLFV